LNPDRGDESGKTPLGWAASEGDEGILKVLLERKDVNPDHADTEYGRTPLSWAAGRGHKGIVKILLKRDDVNPDQADKSGKTPLSWAALEGHEEIFKMLSQRGDVDSDKANHASLLPSDRPANEFVEIQFSSHDPNIDITNSGSQPKPTRAAHGEQPRLPNLQGSVSKSAAHNTSTRPSCVVPNFSHPTPEALPPPNEN